MAKKEKEHTHAYVGRIGEVIFGNRLAKQGKEVLHSPNPYDNKKDMVIDGKKYEIKTQVPFVTENAFTIRENQLEKCKTVDWLVFISVPNKEREHFSSGKAYAVKGKHLKTRIKKTRDGRKMVLIPIDTLSELFTLTNDECKLLMKYSVSGWNCNG